MNHPPGSPAIDWDIILADGLSESTIDDEFFNTVMPWCARYMALNVLRPLCSCSRRQIAHRLDGLEGAPASSYVEEGSLPGLCNASPQASAGSGSAGRGSIASDKSNVTSLSGLSRAPFNWGTSSPGPASGLHHASDDAPSFGRSSVAMESEGLVQSSVSWPTAGVTADACAIHVMGRQVSPRFRLLLLSSLFIVHVVVLYKVTSSIQLAPPKYLDLDARSTKSMSQLLYGDDLLNTTLDRKAVLKSRGSSQMQKRDSDDLGRSSKSSSRWVMEVELEHRSHSMQLTA